MLDVVCLSVWFISRLKIAEFPDYVHWCHCRWLIWAIEKMLNIVWCLAAGGADVEDSIFTDSALVGVKESTMSGS